MKPSLSAIPRIQLLFFVLFLLSGFCGLVYELVWSHYLKLLLGHAAYAQALVLVIFMGGMGLGAWFAGHYSGRWQNLLVGYALAEVGLGIAALSFHGIFETARSWLFEGWGPGWGSPQGTEILKWGLGALLILPQSFLLGLTFPLMSGGLLRCFPERPGRTLAWLYFCNSLGGVLGIMAVSLFSVRLLGLPGSLEMAGVLSLLLAATVLAVSRSFAAAPGAVSATKPKRGAVHPYRLLLLLAFLTGFASFLYEIGWIRMLSLVLGSSTHAFELMLSAFILGLALGGAWIRSRLDGLSNPWRFLGWVQVAMGVAALLSLVLYGGSFEAMSWLFSQLPRDEGGYWLFRSGSLVVALVIMLPATFFAGMTLPLVTLLLFRSGWGERSIGAVLSANTFGAIGGTLVAVHVGFLYLGVKGLMVLGGAIDLALGLWLLWRYRTQRRLGWGWVVPAITGGLLVWVPLEPLSMASGVYRTGQLLDPQQHRVLAYRDGKTASISLVSSPGEFVSIRTNGKPDSGLFLSREARISDDFSTTTLLAAIPMLLNPQARTAAAIGFGAGVTPQVLLENPRMTQVDVIEIEPVMVELAKGFAAYNAQVFTDERAQIYIDDAKAFFARRGASYDLIISNPSNPWVSGVSSLFSREFYAQARRHLNEGGTFAQWLQLYEIDSALMASIIKALSAEFDDYDIFLTSAGDVLVVAQKAGRMGRLQEIDAFPAVLQPAFERVGLRHPDDLRMRWLGGKTLLAPLFNSYPLPANSDYFPVLDQTAEQARFVRRQADELLLALLTPNLPIRQLLSGLELSVHDSRFGTSANLPQTEAYLLATRLRDRLLGVERANPIGHSKARWRGLSAQADALATQCKRSATAGGGLDSLFDLMFVLLPYLNPAEMASIWEQAPAFSCLSQLPPGDQQWVLLFIAIGERDHAAILNTAYRLLEDHRQLPVEVEKFLLRTAAIGLLGLEERDQLGAIWQRYDQLQASEGDGSVLVRLLRASAGEQVAVP